MFADRPTNNGKAPKPVINTNTSATRFDPVKTSAIVRAAFSAPGGFRVCWRDRLSATCECSIRSDWQGLACGSGDAVGVSIAGAFPRMATLYLYGHGIQRQLLVDITEKPFKVKFEANRKENPIVNGTYSEF